MVREVADELVPRLSRHPVPQGTHRTSLQFDDDGVEERRLRQRAAERARHELEGARSLDLEAEERGVAVGAHRRVRVGRGGDVVAAPLGVEPHPVLRRRDARERVAPLALAQQDAVRDDVAVVGHRDELLGLPDREPLVVVGADIRQQARRVWPLEDGVGHVEGEVGDGDAVAPGRLLDAPSGVLRRDDGNVPRRGIRMPEQPHGGAGAIDRVLKRGDGHGGGPFLSGMPCAQRSRKSRIHCAVAWISPKV